MLSAFSLASPLHVILDRWMLIVLGFQAKSPWYQRRCPQLLSLLVQSKHGNPISLVTFTVVMWFSLGQWDKGEIHWSLLGKIFLSDQRKGIERESRFVLLASCFWKGSGNCVMLGAAEYTAEQELLLTHWTRESRKIENWELELWFLLWNYLFSNFFLMWENQMYLLFKLVLVTLLLEAESNLTDTRHKLNDMSNST